MFDRISATTARAFLLPKILLIFLTVDQLVTVFPVHAGDIGPHISPEIGYQHEVSIVYPGSQCKAPNDCLAFPLDARSATGVSESRSIS